MAPNFEIHIFQSTGLHALVGKMKLQLAPQPILASLGAHSVATLVVPSQRWGPNFGCSKVFHIINMVFRKVKAGVRIGEKKSLKQPITKFTLTILVGYARVSPKNQLSPLFSFS